MVEADVLRMVASLAFIVLVILGGAWFMRRTGLLRAGPAQSLRVVGSQSLGARSSVVIVQVDDARLVVGVTPQQITLLHTMPPGDPSLENEHRAMSATRQAGFTQSLRSAMARRRAGIDSARS